MSSLKLKGSLRFIDGTSPQFSVHLLPLRQGSCKQIKNRAPGWPDKDGSAIVAVQVLDLIVRARDINKISSIYVTKKSLEIPYLTNYIALEKDKEEIVICEAPLDKLPKTRIMVLESGKIAFTGSLAEFQACDLPSVKRLLTLDQHDHSADPYFADPWDKTRRPQERLL